MKNFFMLVSLEQIELYIFYNLTKISFNKKHISDIIVS